MLGGSVEGEVLVKHSCLVVRSDPPPWMVHRRLISSSTEQGSKGELTVLGGTCQALSYRLGIDIVPWGPSGAGGGGGRVEVMKQCGGLGVTRRSRGA